MLDKAGMVTEDLLENLILLVGFCLRNLKKGTNQPFPIGLDRYFVCNPGMNFAAVLAGGQR